ncbi:34053_t:CDS:1, partial [Gigaspora margarita]
ETLQTLLALLNNNSDSSQNQPSYLGIPDGNKTLFLPADRHERRKPIVNTPIMRKKNGQALDTSSGLVETEVVGDPDDEMTEGQGEPEKHPEVRPKPEPSKKNDVK